MTRTIAIVEDDTQQRAHYAHALREQGYRVQDFADREQALRAFGRALPDLAILDIVLGVEIGAGFDICRYLQERDLHLPVLFLTSRGDEIDKIYGLQLGAWDYQAKPVTLEYLLARIVSLFRIRDRTRRRPERGEVHALGKLEMDVASMRACWGGRALPLTPTEFDLLRILVTRSNGASYDDLADATKQGVVENNTINTHIVHLRKKFKEVDPRFDCIRTKYGYGYHWVCR